MKTCPSCGGAVSENAKACGHCGAWLARESAAASASGSVTAGQPKRAPWLVTFLAIVIALGIVGGAAWLGGAFLQDVLYNPYNYAGETAGPVGAGIIGLGGLVLVVLVARDVWRRRRISLSPANLLFFGSVLSLVVGSVLGWSLYGALVNSVDYTGEIAGLASGVGVWLLGIGFFALLSAVLTVRARKRA